MTFIAVFGVAALALGIGFVIGLIVGQNELKSAKKLAHENANKFCIDDVIGEASYTTEYTTDGTPTGVYTRHFAILSMNKHGARKVQISSTNKDKYAEDYHNITAQLNLWTEGGPIPETVNLYDENGSLGQMLQTLIDKKLTGE
jgi:hypothetical protein